MEGSWRKQCTPYRYIDEHRSRRRDYEVETLTRFDTLARTLESQAGVTTEEVTV
jgi:hypothetical protein